MVNSRQIALCAALFGALPPGLSAAPVSGTWHAASTPAEHALDAILKKADHDDNQLDNLFAGRGRKSFQPTFDYREVLTDPLLAAIRRAEADLLRQDCGGKYLEGDECGLGFLPIECSQEVGETYVYHTETENGLEATIDSAAPTDSASPAATYNLVWLAGEWKIDGIKCRQGPSFNMP